MALPASASELTPAPILTSPNTTTTLTPAPVKPGHGRASRRLPDGKILVDDRH